MRWRKGDVLRPTMGHIGARWVALSDDDGSGIAHARLTHHSGTSLDSEGRGTRVKNENHTILDHRWPQVNYGLVLDIESQNAALADHADYYDAITSLD